MANNDVPSARSHTETSSGVLSASFIEDNGVNPVPDAERYGKPRMLFPIWFSWNVSLLGVSYGIFVFMMGLSWWQAILAGILGYAISTGLVGVIAIGGPRTGLPTMTQTRFAFGYRGNIIPTLFSYLSNTGWQVVTITVASTSGASLLAKLAPATFATEANKPTIAAIALCFTVVLALVMVITVIGYQLILKVETYIAWITGILTVIFFILVIPHIKWDVLTQTPNGSFSMFIAGLVLAMTMIGLGFLNAGGDFARYLPRKTNAKGVIGWTTLGISLPVSVLLIMGVLLAASDPTLADAAAMDPIGALADIIPTWFLIPFILTVMISLIAGAVTGVYASGLALISLGIPISRAVSTIINVVVIAAGCFYLLFISDRFFDTFQAYLSLMAVVVGTMAAIQIIDFVRQRRLNWDVRMALPKGYGGRNGRWTAIVSLVLAAFLGFGLITSGDPNIAKVVGFLLSDEAKAGAFGSSNVGILIAMAVGAILYALLTYVFKIDLPPDFSKLTAEEVANASEAAGEFAETDEGAAAVVGTEGSSGEESDGEGGGKYVR